MIDEDEVSIFETPSYTAALEDKLNEVSKLALPFDLQNIVDPNPFIFGELGDGKLLGEYARYLGGTIKTLDGSDFEAAEGVGQIIGDFAGRVIIAFECEAHGFLYLGWLNPEDYELVTIHFPETQKWMH